MSHSSMEGGTGKISDWITGIKYFKWALFPWISNVLKVAFYLEKQFW